MGSNLSGYWVIKIKTAFPLGSSNVFKRQLWASGVIKWALSIMAVLKKPKEGFEANLMLKSLIWEIWIFSFMGSIKTKSGWKFFSISLQEEHLPQGLWDISFSWQLINLINSKATVFFPNFSWPSNKRAWGILFNSKDFFKNCQSSDAGLSR